eukprot:TRINITY_DN2402_c0_g1_i5.p1 TRINITY_DN2402_c0_g1~~TRINITY_DN2402_c0_g1_i5.p1  ORF type:complete len:273 (+),score=79.86 TRINITY_DN2402_c0_g1_i5:492-1310(+)
MLLLLLRDDDLSCVRLALDVVIPLVLQNIIKIEGKLHFLAECLISKDDVINTKCHCFFQKYLAWNKISFAKIIFQIFCSLSENFEKKRLVMERLIQGFGGNQQDNLSCIFLSSLGESMDVEKFHVLSLLKPSKRSLEELERYLPEQNENEESSLGRLILANSEIFKFIVKFLSNSSEANIKDRISNILKNLNLLKQKRKTLKATKKHLSGSSIDEKGVFSLERLDKLKRQMDAFTFCSDEELEEESKIPTHKITKRLSSVSDIRRNKKKRRF